MKYWTSLFILIISFSLLYSTTDDIGITCDEAWINDSAAKSFAGWLKLSAGSVLKGDFSTFRNKETIEIYFGDHFHYHPPLGRMMHALTWVFFKDSLGDIKALRLSPEIMFSLVCVLVFLLTLKITDIPSALISSFGLLFMPRMFGHGHIFALDMPITFMMILTVYIFLEGRDRWYGKLLFAISLGLALSTKAHALMIPASILIWLIIYPDKRTGKSIIYALLVSPFVFYLSNPWLWVSFSSHLAEFMGGMAAHTSDFVVKTYYFGNIYESNAVPWHYAPVITFLTIPAPLAVLILIETGICAYYILKKISRRKIIESQIKEKYSVFFLINGIAPIAAISIGIGPAYDGERLFLPAFAFLAILSGIGFFNLKALFINNKYQLIASLSALTIIISSAYSLYMIHPYELSYYNFFAGGLKGAKRLGLESTYWGDPFNTKVLEFLNTKIKTGKIANRCGFNSIPFDYYHRYGMLSKEIVYDKDNYDYLVINFREGFFNEEINFYINNIKPVFSAGTDDVPLIAVYKNIEHGIPSELFGKNRFEEGWIEIATSLIDDKEEPISIEKSTNQGFPFLNNMIPGDIKITSAAVKAVFKAPENDSYIFQIYSTGIFSVSIDSQIFFKSDSFRNHYKVKSIILKKGYHNVDMQFIPNSSKKRFFTVLVSASG